MSRVTSQEHADAHDLAVVVDEERESGEERIIRGNKSAYLRPESQTVMSATDTRDVLVKKRLARAQRAEKKNG